MLGELAQRLMGELRGEELLARHGGEEFVVWMPGSDPERASRLGERLREVVGSEPFVFEGDPIRVTLSMGIVHVREYDTSCQVPDLVALLRRAEWRLDRAKAQGRDRVIDGES